MLHCRFWIREARSSEQDFQWSLVYLEIRDGAQLRMAVGQHVFGGRQALFSALVKREGFQRWNCIGVLPGPES